MSQNKISNMKQNKIFQLLLPNTLINGIPNKLVYNMFSNPIKTEEINNQEIFETITENKNTQLLLVIVGLIILIIAIILIIKLFKKSNKD